MKHLFVFLLSLISWTHGHVYYKPGELNKFDWQRSFEDCIFQGDIVIHHEKIMGATGFTCLNDTHQCTLV